MLKIIFKTILVIGDNHQEIARKYSADNPNNPNAFYKFERCHQHRLEVTGEEGDFSDPFPLKNGGISYSAHFNEIDWEKLHNNKKKINLNRRVWELVVENAEPNDEIEKDIKSKMFERIAYFTDNFKNKEEYVKYSTSLWYWGVATEEKYEEVNDKISAMDWCVNFYDTYIQPLKETNPLITIYEVKAL